MKMTIDGVVYEGTTEELLEFKKKMDIGVIKKSTPEYIKIRDYMDDYAEGLVKHYDENTENISRLSASIRLSNMVDFKKIEGKSTILFKFSDLELHLQEIILRSHPEYEQLGFKV